MLISGINLACQFFPNSLTVMEPYGTMSNALLRSRLDFLHFHLVEVSCHVSAVLVISWYHMLPHAPRCSWLKTSCLLSEATSCLLRNLLISVEVRLVGLWLSRYQLIDFFILLSYYRDLIDLLKLCGSFLQNSGLFHLRNLVTKLFRCIWSSKMMPSSFFAVPFIET